MSPYVGKHLANPRRGDCPYESDSIQTTPLDSKSDSKGERQWNEELKVYNKMDEGTEVRHEVVLYLSPPIS